MRIALFSVCLIASAGILPAQTAEKLQLRGDRFAPLHYETMNPAQKAMVDGMLGDERGGRLTGPFNVMLRNPAWGDYAQKMGAQLRFHSSLSPRLSEFAILITARIWTAQYEWQAHHANALKGGLEPGKIAALAEGERPAAMMPDEEAVYLFTTELLQTHQVSDATFRIAKDRLTEQGVVDLMGLVGYYQTVSMLLNVDRYPLNEGSKPELPVLAAGHQFK